MAADEPLPAQPRALPNPQRFQDPQYGVLPKVFVVYPLNPAVYTWIDPPKPVEQMNHDELQAFSSEAALHDQQQEEVVKNHQALIRRFAEFLQKSRIAVAYDQLLLDSGAENQMKWYQEQIADSDYAILVITPSFREFLESECPPEREHIFTGHYLHNLINRPPPNLRLLPVFLNQYTNVDLLPVALRAARVFQIFEPFDVQVDDLSSLYAILTNQRLCEAPVSDGVVRVKPKRRGFGGGVSNQTSMPNSQRLHTLLSSSTQPLSTGQLTCLSQQAQFSANCQELARGLGLSEAQAEQCQARGRDDPAEVCYQVLRAWRDKLGASQATVSQLASAIQQIRKFSMLDVLYEVSKP